MNNIDIILMALKNLFKRKLRTFLTILGVVIGTASIIVMISLGLALNKNVDNAAIEKKDTFDERNEKELKIYTV